MEWNWFAITGWAIVLSLGHVILRAVSKIYANYGESVGHESLGLVIATLIGVWVVVAIQRGS